MTTIETQLRRELHKYAVEVRKAAYSLPNGVGEHALLRLSEQMDNAAGLDRLQVTRHTNASGALPSGAASAAITDGNRLKPA